MFAFWTAVRNGGFRLQLNLQRLLRQPQLISLFRVSLHFPQAFVAGYGCDLMRRAASVGEPGRRGLAQSVKRALRQACGVALIAKPITETARRERARPTL